MKLQIIWKTPSSSTSERLRVIMSTGPVHDVGDSTPEVMVHT